MPRSVSKIESSRSNCGSSRSTGGVGIIGIGLLGSVIADGLAKGFDPIYGYDAFSSRSKNVALLKASREVFEKCNTVVFCLPSSEEVNDVIDEVSGALIEGRHLIIDSTTGDPESSEKNEVRLSAMGVGYVEATIAGSSGNLKQGEAAILLAGKEAHMDEAEKYMSVLSPRVHKVGAIGAAARFKLVHNLILGLNRAAFAEGLAFAEKLGFDLEQTLDILLHSPAYSATMSLKGRQMVAGEYSNPQARLSQHRKDVGLILEQGALFGASVPLSALHYELLTEAKEMGYGDQDNCSIVEVFRGRPSA